MATLPAETYPAAPLLCHTAEHGVPIALPGGMDKEEKEAALRCGTHVSALKEADLIHTKMAKHVQAGHVALFPLEAVNSLQNLWLSPVAVISWEGRRSRLILYFTRSRLNKASKRLSPMEAMRFKGALQRILRQVLTAEPQLGTVYLRKVYLA